MVEISLIRCLSLALVLMLALGACGGRSQSLDPAAARRLEDAEALAERAAGTASELRARVAQLEEKLDAEKSDRETAAERLVAAARRLRRALESVRATAAAGSAVAAEAKRSASAAAGEAHSAAEDASVLTERFDYHLRRYHGGG